MFVLFVAEQRDCNSWKRTTHLPYADYTTLLVIGETQTCEYLNVLNEFWKVSGLYINIEKTIVNSLGFERYKL